MEEGKKKEGFFKRLGKDLRLQVLYFGISMLVLVLAYSALLNHIKVQNTLKRNETIDASMMTAVEMKKNSAKIHLSGWTAKRGVNFDKVVLVFKPLSGGREIILNTQNEVNEELNEYLVYMQDDELCGYGFETEVSASRIKKNMPYEIFLEITYSKENAINISKISTNQYLYNDEMYLYNPKNFSVPEVEHTEINTVIENGVVCGYDMEQGVWIYFYDGELYWMLDKKIVRNNEEQLFMFCHVWPNDINALPEVSKKYGFENRDFYFSEYERDELLCENYRIAKMPLGVEYPVLYINTGHYDAEQGNIWSLTLKVGREYMKFKRRGK